MRPSVNGVLRLPGDESISRLLLILGAMGEGRTFIDNLSRSDDVLATLNALRALGVEVSAQSGRAGIKGSHWRGLSAPRKGLDAGGSAEAAILLMGVLAGSDVMADIDGDESLRRRPMAFAALPLRLMGADISLEGGRCPPITVRGSALQGIAYRAPYASRAVKAAVLLAGLLAIGETSYEEAAPSADHAERLLPLFGAQFRREGARCVVRGGLNLSGATMVVPGDPAIASFWAVAATLARKSEVVLEDVCLNPERLAFARALRRMGAEVETRLKDEESEPRGDLLARSAKLRGADIEGSGAIEELPLLAVAATQAAGTTRFAGAAKPEGRLTALLGLLKALGADAALDDADLRVEGGRRLKSGRVSCGGDARLALAALAAGLVADVSLADAKCVGTLYPSFSDDYRSLTGKTL